MKLMPLAPIMEIPGVYADPRVYIAGPDTAQQLATAIRATSAQEVWFEGFPGAGKTTLSRKVAACIEWPVMELDEQLMEVQPEGASYAERMDRSKLKSLRDGFEKSAIVLDGICLRDVVALHGLGRRASAFVIYVARVSQPVHSTYCWHDGLQLESSDFGSESWLWPHCIDYHKRERPHETADAVVLRVE